MLEPLGGTTAASQTADVPTSLVYTASQQTGQFRFQKCRVLKQER